jgi:hypothetical protein
MAMVGGSCLQTGSILSVERVHLSCWNQNLRKSGLSGLSERLKRDCIWKKIKPRVSFGYRLNLHTLLFSEKEMKHNLDSCMNLMRKKVCRVLHFKSPFAFVSSSCSLSFYILGIDSAGNYCTHFFILGARFC